ncbi:lipoprotein [Candidatus Photodesmus blepharus]|uniref:Outer membrane protein assembly factor BamD n=1 Tax=Candidatus Photodesmus blepharonis TaxID=1179155 RepID=A0A084CNU7_9GAMM|nr:outer membrane protein assembly factor BamD [Candidatus Photodesmus blepharus]KEY91476.1 lipoprotein [Candidatus Photodesmus blepharus]
MKYRILLGLFILLPLFGCLKNKETISNTTPSALYFEAQNFIQSRNWLGAIKKLETLDTHYPFSPYSKQMQLDLIYAYYKNNDSALTLATIERFVKLNPSHEKMDKILYIRGLTNMARDSNLIHNFFDVNRNDRDPEPAKSALHDFDQLLKHYPNSPYVLQSQKYISTLRNRLAEHDLAVARFYLKRHAWIAAINRAQKVQREYPNFKIASQSLKIQLQAYKELGLKELVERTEKLLEQKI